MGRRARSWGVREAGSTHGDLVSIGDAGMSPPEVGFVPKSACWAGFLQGCSRVLQHPPRRGLVPTSPPQPGLGDLSPGDQHPFGPAAPPAGLCVCVPHPLQALPAGRNRRGLSQLSVNIGFSGAVAGPRQRRRLSPPRRHRRGFHSPRPCRPFCPPPKKKMLLGRARPLLPCKPGHGAGVTAVSGSGVRALHCGAVWRGLCSPPPG